MTAQVTGIGTGIFILLSVWIVVFILCLVSLRVQNQVGLIAFISAVTLTTILLIIPVGNKDFEDQDHKESDYHFIWSNIVAAILGITGLFSISALYTNYCVEPLNTVPVCT